MSNYLSLTDKERRQMLKSIGADTMDDLFEDVPTHLRIEKLDLPKGKTQQETIELFSGIASENKQYRSIMRGAGSYHHYIPSVVKSLSSRSEFLTAYTPYQAEMSQGILQAIFEFQTMICRLTGMDLSNASVYNGSSAAADAILMCADRKRPTVIVADTIRPDTRAVIETYIAQKKMRLEVVPSKDGRLDPDVLAGALGDHVACVYVEQPNYLGQIEQCEEIGALTHQHGAKFIMGCNPVALALLKTPRACGADIAVGEAQPFGLPISFGGPYLGYMACTEKEMRKMPGRIVGETTDHDGRRAFVLTLQAREQHIRREKAFSNICSNQAYCALVASIYLAAMGPAGLKEVAQNCLSLAHYAAEAFVKAGAQLKYDGPFFHEFVTVTEGSADEILKKLEKKGILGGLKLSEHEILWCMTEMVQKQDITKAAAAIRGTKA